MDALSWMDGKRLVFENAHSTEEGAAFLWDGKDLIVAVVQEKAMDSYNTDIECQFSMSRDDAIKLRDWLTENVK